MSSRVSSGLTACVAIAGATVIAATPVVASPPTPTRVVEASVALTGVSDFIGKKPDALLIMAAERLAQQPQQVPFIPAIAAAAIVAGDNDRLYTVARSIIDAPLYVADPLIYAAAAILPESQGGNPEEPANSAIWTEFRDGTLYGLRQDLHGVVADALGVSADQDANYAYDLSNKLIESGIRLASLPVLQASSLITLAQAVEGGNNVEIYKVVRDYIDGPQWAIDPAIDGIAEALPTSLGGGTNHNPKDPNGDGTLMQFRNKEMLGVRNAVRVAAANVLGVDVKPDGNLPDPAAKQSQQATLQADAPETGKRDVSNLKPHVTNLNAKIKKSVDDAKDRAEKRRETVKTNVENAVNKAKTAASNLTKKVTSKKESGTSKDESKGSED
ncbi:hypothetical protein A5733_04035 [Mycobacterium sp. NS-7484]|uniref:YtxH domain-containing protein n=1 Tax=Mycobacterium sp. NS-7484 TaxID=1834161 RepID=UPI00096ED6C1|nr:YtxH domain-containing protein [Mycobacterium sp. NS-7484]OMC00483.1 hypothetical protein A5733_04035 [Mycobacterium sp. NS-7484]